MRNLHYIVFIEINKYKYKRSVRLLFVAVFTYILLIFLTISLFVKNIRFREPK